MLKIFVLKLSSAAMNPSKLSALIDSLFQI